MRRRIGFALALTAVSCAEDAPAGRYSARADRLLGAAVAAPAAEAPMAGLLFVAPLKSRFSYLLDPQGEVLHRWESRFFPGADTELLEDGSILRCGRVPNAPALSAGGQGGCVQRIAWDGTVVWEYTLSDSNVLHHHDAEPMPNGNVLLLAWERKSAEEALARGRDPALLQGEDFWPDWIAEVKPAPPAGGEIVWEGLAWDHVIQDRDPDLLRHGSIAEHPELIDINGDRPLRTRSLEEVAAEEERLVALGYAGEAAPSGSSAERGAPGADAAGLEPDWMHANSISYHPELDLIVISVRRFHEAWVIDHSTSTAEAAWHAGGRHGRGGNLLYRWGNPAAHGAGGAAERRLFFQHDVRWIPGGLPGAGNLICFNNGEGRPDGDHSSIEEWRLPIEPDGRILPGPDAPAWRFVAEPKESFYSAFISGVQRLPNGSTLITEGETGRLLEVSAGGRVLWEWRNPYGGEEGQTARSGRSARVPQKALFRAVKIPLHHVAARRALGG